MSSYVTRNGDTFDIISRRVYGEESGASRIRQANPGAIEPFVAGVQLQIPQTNTQLSRSTVDRENPNRIAIYTAGRRLSLWDTVTVTRSLDAVDAYSLTAPFEPEEPSSRAIFRPFDYQEVQINVGGEPLFRGIQVDVTPVLDQSKRMVSVGGYSFPGVLWDCTVPASSVPVEFNGVTLDVIAKSVAAPFGIDVRFEGSIGPAFDQVAMETDQKVGDFLTNLAQQRNLVIGSSEIGTLVFRTDQTTSAPVARFREGDNALITISPSFRPQSFYSHITGFEPSILGLFGGQYTVRNPAVEVIRPLNFTVTDVLEGEVEAAVRAKAARMYAAAASYEVTIPSWRDPQGALWVPGSRVTLEAPGVMVYAPYTFVIRSVTFSRSGDEESAKLNLMIPGAFSGRLPETLPWAS